MKRILPLLLIAPLFLASGTATTTTTSHCVTGTIKYIKYNDDDTLSIGIGNLELYTSRWNLRPLLFSSYILGNEVEIKTNSCYYGGGFSEITFK